MYPSKNKLEGLLFLNKAKTVPTHILPKNLQFGHGDASFKPLKFNNYKKNKDTWIYLNGAIPLELSIFFVIQFYTVL